MQVTVEFKGPEAMSRLGTGARRGNAKALAFLTGVVKADEPVDTTNMRNQTNWEQVEGGGDAFASGMLTVDADYAVYVHERTDLTHETGKDHFVSDNLEDRQKELLAIQATEMRRALTR